MSLVYKVGIIGFGGAVATASTYAGIQYFKKDSSIANHLTSSGYTLISSITNPDHSKLQWKAEFESDRDKIKDLIEFKGSSDEEGGKALEKWCSSKLKEDYSKSSKNLEETKSYCVLRTIESQLSRGNKKILTQNQADDNKWDLTYSKRKSTPQLSPRSQVGLNGTWPVEQTPDTKSNDLPAIKKWCETKVQSYFLAHENTYTHVYNWCTEDGASVAS